MADIGTSVSTGPQWKLLVDQTDPSNIYIGYGLIGTATSAAKWQIRKFANVSNVLQMLYANGSTKANQIWDNRTSLSYS